MSCTVTCDAKFLNLAAAAGVTLIFRSAASLYLVEGISLVLPDESASLTLSSEGTGTIDLSPGVYQVFPQNDATGEGFPPFFVTVPNDPAAYLHVIRNLPPTPSLTAAQQAVLDAQAAASLAASYAALAQAGWISHEFGTRSAAVAWIAAGNTLLPGLSIRAAGVDYLRVVGATAISDMPGYVPDGLITPLHWAENTISGTTDMWAAWAAALAYAASIAVSPNGGVEVSGLGMTYGMSDGLLPVTGVNVIAASFSALASAAWTSTKCMIDIAPDNSTITLRDIKCYCNSIAQNGVRNQSPGAIVLDNVIVRRALLRDFWISADTIGVNLRSGLTAANIVGGVGRTAYSIYLDAAATDSKFTSCVFGPNVVPLYVDTNVHHILFQGCHFFNQVSDPLAPVLTDSTLAEIHGYAIQFTGCYLDLGAIRYYRGVGSPPVDLLIEGCTSVANPTTSATYDAWIELNTAVANSDLKELQISPANRWSRATQIPILKLTTSGAGSWQTNVVLANLPTDNLLTARGPVTILSGNDGTSNILKLMGSGESQYIAWHADAGPVSWTIGQNSANDFVWRNGGVQVFKLDVAGTNVLTAPNSTTNFLRFLNSVGGEDVSFGLNAGRADIRIGSTRRFSVDSAETRIFGQVTLDLGSAAAPSYTWLNDRDTGFFWRSNGIMGVSANGVDAGDVVATTHTQTLSGKTLVSPRIASPSGALVSSGTGSPEGVLAAPVGSLWLRTDGGAGTTLYVKESGTGNTGWAGK